MTLRIPPRATPWLASLLLALAATGGRAGPRLEALTSHPHPAVDAEVMVSTGWLAKRLNRPELIVLHVARDRAGYDRGHVPHARFVDFDDVIASERDGIPNELAPLDRLTRMASRAGLEPGRKIIVYDEGDGLLAARVFFTLEYLGLGGDVAVLDGQLGAWKKERRRLQQAPARFAETRFVARVRPEVLADERLVRDLVWQLGVEPRAPAALVDARPRLHYSGAEVHPAVTRAGHIPGARNVFWKSALRDETDVRLRDEAELRALHGSRLPAAGQVVTYCNTGMQAAHAYLVLRHLGYSPRLYDGSMAEWSRDDTTGVVESKWYR